MKAYRTAGITAESARTIASAMIQVNAMILEKERQHHADLNLAIELGWGDLPFDMLPKDWKTRRRYDPRIKVKF